MGLTLCGTTAFNYYRVPPQILGLYPPLPEPFNDPNRLKLAHSPMAELLGTPLHRLVDNKNQHTSGSVFFTHALKNSLPYGSVYETEHGFEVTSPLATLLTMAGEVDRVNLLMALYEMAGTFTVFQPSETVEQAIEATKGFGSPYQQNAWRRTEDTNGQKTSLWTRPPLLDIAELGPFCEQVAGFHGIKDLRWATENLAGVCASPLEVEAALLLGLPRAAGGEGLDIVCNQRIPLSAAARSIYPHSCCYADILIEGKGDNAGVIVECQGKAVHASDAAWNSDSNRAMALECMGYEVILLTRDQLTIPLTFENVASLIARKASIARRPKTPRQQAAQLDLRRNLFIDWTKLAG